MHALDLLIVLCGAIALIVTTFGRRRYLLKAQREVALRRAERYAGRPGPYCEGCLHFDLELGQAEIRKHETFARVMDHVAPDKMMRKVIDKPDGSVEIVPSGPAGQSWDDYGACMLHGEGRWRYDCCESYQGRLRSMRPGRLPVVS